MKLEELGRRCREHLGVAGWFVTWATLFGFGCSAGTMPLGDGLLEPADASQPASDAAAVPDAEPIEEVEPPTGGCFAETVTIATETFEPGGRPHMSPEVVLGQDDGWLVVYAAFNQAHAVLLDLEGRVRKSLPFDPPSGQAVGIGPSSILFTDGPQRIDVRTDGMEITSWARMQTEEFGAFPGAEKILSTEVLPSGAVRLLTQNTTLLTRTRIIDIARDESPDGLQVLSQQVLPSGALDFNGRSFLAGDRVRGLTSTDGSWRATEHRFDPNTLGSGDAFAFELVGSAMWEGDDEFLPVGFTPDGRRAFVSRYGPEGGFEAYLMSVPYNTSPANGGVLGTGAAQGLFEADGRLAFVSRSGLRVYDDVDLDLDPVAEIALDVTEVGAVRTAHRNALVAAIFVQPVSETNTLSLGLRCLSLPR